MKSLIILLLYVLVLSHHGMAEDTLDENQTFNDLFEKKYISTNIFLKTLKQREELEGLKAELEIINKNLKKKSNISKIHIMHELEDQKQIAESKIQLLSQKQDSLYQQITEITVPNVPFTLLTFFSKQPLKEVDSAIKALMNISTEYQKAYEHTLQYTKEVEEHLNAIEDKTLKNDYVNLHEDVLRDQRFLAGFKELIDKQYEHLLDQQSLIKKQYKTYRDKEFIKHIVALVVIIVLVILAYFLRRLVVRYVKEDDRQFMYNRTISTTAALVGITFFLINYSENLIYSLTVFTFIGAAVVIATREFLLNIVAWVYIALSNFIKVGDRVLVPHETKYYFGDIINISPIKITLYEAYDFSSTKEAVNAGRIIFIPNSYIFSHAVISYTHQTQKSIFDHIALSLAIDSDLEKAESITKEVIREETGEYVDHAKQQFNELKKRYDIKQRMLEPEVQFVINSTAMTVKMTAWYMTPSQNATSVKNRLIKTLLKRINNEKSIRLSSRKTKTTKETAEEENES